MVLDISEEMLRERFANCQVAVMGERSLYQKLLPVMVIRERRLNADFLPMAMFSKDELCPICVDVVAYGSLYDALPMLDVVLTPNGLATVGNNTLSPASAARSEAARKSVADLLFQSQCALLDALRRSQDWLDSRYAAMFGRSLFVDLLELCRLNPDRSSDSYDLSMVMQVKTAVEEDRIAEKYISPELMSHLRRANLAHSGSCEEYHVISRVRDAVRLTVQSDARSGQFLIDVVNYIRERPENFPLWHSSRTALQFQDYTFKNSRNSGGFYF